MIKTGIGYDIHPLVEGRKLFLGGVEIPYVKGLSGHSDGDALLHAICDAMLGAAGEGDIGEHFPDTDSAYHGISSLKLLKAVSDLVKKKGFSIGNIDAVVIAGEPNLAPFKKLMRRGICGVLDTAEDNVNIKAKTNNGLGGTGSKESIACFASIVLFDNSR